MLSIESRWRWRRRRAPVPAVRDATAGSAVIITTRDHSARLDRGPRGVSACTPRRPPRRGRSPALGRAARRLHRRRPYSETAAQLVIPAWLHRVVYGSLAPLRGDGGAEIEARSAGVAASDREYAVGSRRWHRPDAPAPRVLGQADAIQTAYLLALVASSGQGAHVVGQCCPQSAPRHCDRGAW